MNLRIPSVVIPLIQSFTRQIPSPVFVLFDFKLQRFPGVKTVNCERLRRPTGTYPEHIPLLSEPHSLGAVGSCANCHTEYAFFIVVFAPPVRNLNTLAILTGVFARQVRIG